MRIALVRRSYRVDGGAESMLMNILSALGQDTSVTVLTEKWPRNDALKINIVPVSVSGWTRTRRQKSFVASVQSHLAKNHYDLVQSHERVPGVHLYRAGDGVHRAWLDIRKRIRGPLESLSQRLSPFHRTLLKQEEALFRHPDLKVVICNSEMVKREIQRYYHVESSKLRIIRNGVDLERFHPVSPEVRSRLRQHLGLPEGLLLIYCGSGFERKGLKVLLEALSLCNTPWHLVILGTDKSINQYRRQADTLGLADRVYFTGPVRNPEQFFQAGDLHVHPAWYDPMPNASLEAMACGLGVITTDGCGTAELLTDMTAGQVVPRGEAETLAHALDEATDAFETWRDGARAIADNLSIHQLRDSLMSLYSEVV